MKIALNLTYKTEEEVPMPNSLFKIVDWVEKNGEVQSVARLRAKLLPLTCKEGLIFHQIGPDTNCSNQYLDACRSAATEIVGNKCPF